jgi:thiol:disulfide interchange protein DsbA
MQRFLERNKGLATVLLALTGIGVMVAYIFCLGSCSYLKGDVLGVDLKYAGIAYMTVILILAALRQALPCLLLLAFGAGGELFLMGYQVRTGIYCPYCLVFATTVFAALFVNFERTRRGLVALIAAAGLLFFLSFFSASTTPVPVADSPAPTYGRGAVEVRIYTDYFCGPCRAEEGEVMALVTGLAEKDLIRVIFIDTPVHPETVLYADYFLSALNAKPEGGLPLAVQVRAALFEAAGQEIKKKEALEDFLRQKGIPWKPFDSGPAFRIFGNYLQEDRIQSTPSCVIIGPQGKRTLRGKDEIVPALREIRSAR